MKLFWNSIQNEINIIFKVVIHLNTDFVLLGQTINNIQNEKDRHLLRILRVAALKQVTRNWLQKSCPMIDKWRDTVQQIYNMEYLTYKLRGNLKVFDRRWSKWSMYYIMVTKL